MNKDPKGRVSDDIVDCAKRERLMLFRAIYVDRRRRPLHLPDPTLVGPLKEHAFSKCRNHHPNFTITTSQIRE